LSSLRQIMCVFAFFPGMERFPTRVRIAVAHSLDNNRETLAQ
jgi:hypothetical protein